MNETKKPAVRFKGFSVEWERHPMDELTTELHEYATLDSLYPLLTSSREGIMFQNEYRSNRTTENNKTLFSIVPYLQKTTLLKGLDNWRIFSLGLKGKAFIERVAAE